MPILCFIVIFKNVRKRKSERKTRRIQLINYESQDRKRENYFAHNRIHWQ